MLRSGEVARRAGVSTDTLRHYERRGLIPPPARQENRYRAYAPETVERVLLIQRALSIGFTLDELGRILKNRDRGGTPCRQVRELAARKLSELDQRLVDLQNVRKELQELLAVWDDRLSRTPEGQRAGLLDALVGRGLVRRTVKIKRKNA